MNGNSSQRNGTSMWFRWAWRDLKGQWLAVVAIGLVLAIGTGVFAGLGSTATWRRLSNDASFAALYLHDVRFELSPGTFAPEGSLVEAVSSSGVADAVEVVEERLVVDSQIDTTPAVEGAGTLVAARLVGMDLSSDVAVDRLWVRDGSAPVAGVAAAAEAIVEVKFADAVGMDTAGTLLVAGGRELAYSGLGVIPEDYYYEGPPGALFSLGELAPVYLHKADLQALVGREGQVNDLVVRLADGADSEAVISQIGAVLDESGLSYTATTYDEEYAVRVLYDDIESDQQVWNMISGLILGAAALAAF
ncbi:MAG: hypothetical protein GY925_22615, partial [Actinomycetia bacterium]|nr:hypothetical protein [Actinomycetes bacterium]